MIEETMKQVSSVALDRGNCKFCRQQMQDVSRAHGFAWVDGNDLFGRGRSVASPKAAVGGLDPALGKT